MGVSLAENQLRKAVFVAIYANPRLYPYTRVSGGTIHIVVQGSVVTLQGEVASVSDHEFAEELAERVHGVSKVVNNLIVRG